MKNMLEIWRSLTAEDRLDAATAFWLDAERAQSHADAIAFLAAQRGGFRKAFLERQSSHRRAKMLAQARRLPGDLVEELIVALFLGPRCDVLKDTLTGLDIRHDERGTLVEDASEIDAPPLERCRSALGRVRTQHGGGIVDPLVDALYAMHPAVYEHLPAARDEILASEPPLEDAPLGDEVLPKQASASYSEADWPELHAHQFSKLDQMLIRAVVESVSGIEGCMEEDEVADMVDELVHLNTARQRSYFHRGFYAGMTAGDLGLDAPGMNPQRREWCLAGIWCAYRRQNRWGDIVALLEERRADCGPILSGESPATEHAIGCVVDALLALGKDAQLVERVDSRAVAALSAQAFLALFGYARDLLDEESAQRAGRLLDLVLSAFRPWLGELGREAWREPRYAELRSAVLEANRGRATAHRLLGDLDKSRQLLQMHVDQFDDSVLGDLNSSALELKRSRAHMQKLLGDLNRVEQELQAEAEHPDRSDLLGDLDERRQEIQICIDRYDRTEECPGEVTTLTRMHTDLGILAAGYRSMSKIRFPDQEDETEALLERLVAGRASFERAAELSSEWRFEPRSQLCLGLIAWCEGDPTKALLCAERAVSGFEGQAARYERGGVIARAKLLMGWALASNFEGQRLDLALEYLAEAASVLKGEGFFVVVDALKHLAELNPARTAVALVDMVEASRRSGMTGEALYEVAQDPKLLRESEQLRSMLLERPGRTRSERSQDLTTLLRVAEQNDLAELAALALDGLEELAIDSPHSDETTAFLAMLERDDVATTGWDGRDIQQLRIKLLYDRGDLFSAAALMEQLAFSMLGEGHTYFAEDLVADMAKLGVADYPSETLSATVEAQAQAEPDAPVAAAERAKRRGLVVFVGGNEIQAQYDEQVKARIQSDYPKVLVQFEHTGWSSNWSAKLARFEGDLQQAKAFVIHRFVRTNLGRRLRKMAGELGVSWMPCTGSGAASIERSIRRSIEMYL